MSLVGLVGCPAAFAMVLVTASELRQPASRLRCAQASHPAARPCICRFLHVLSKLLIPQVCKQALYNRSICFKFASTLYLKKYSWVTAAFAVFDNVAELKVRTNARPPGCPASPTTVQYCELHSFNQDESSKSSDNTTLNQTAT
jgi:hypothetical protein